MTLGAAFLEQAGHCRALGSDFTARLLEILPGLLATGGPVGARILTWPGDPRSSADSVPLRMAAGLHALVLSDRHPALARLYPPGEAPDTGALREAVRDAMLTHADFLLDWLKSPPQTNESGRSAPLVAAGKLLTQHVGLPLRLLELGTSAGLNLRWDHVALDLNGRRFGPENAGLTLCPDWTGPAPLPAVIRVASRAGTDLNPLDPADANARLRLMAYIWPDQPDRLTRMQAAITLARKLPARVSRKDAIDWLEAQLATPAPGLLTTVFHTIAWQYFPAETQARGTALIAAHGAQATPDAPLAHLSMEADGQGPGAALCLRLWPIGAKQTLGRADFHGRWVNWQPPAGLN